MTGPSLLTEMPGLRKADLRRGGRTRCPPERARTATRRHLERPSSPPHNTACLSGSWRSSCGLFRSSPTTRIVPPPRPRTQLRAAGVPSQVTAPTPQPEIPRSSSQAQWGCGRQYSSKHSSGAALRRYLESPDAARTSLTPAPQRIFGCVLPMRMHPWMRQWQAFHATVSS